MQINSAIPEKFVKEATQAFPDFFQSGFGVIYGSLITNTGSADSDLDIVFCCPEKNLDFFDSLKEFVVTFHITNSLAIDNEISFENKLLVSFDQCQQIANLSLLKNGHVKPIVKDRKFLESSYMQQRLLLNILTTPHLAFGCLVSYESLKKLALKKLLSIAQNISRPSHQTAVDSLLYSSDSTIFGEEYLGYKDNSLIRQYLETILSQ